MATIIGVDHGNFAIKTEHHTFVSGLSEHLTEPPFAEEMIEYDGKYYTLSSKHISYRRDKTKDDRFFILTLFAIAKELESRAEDLEDLDGVSVVLAVGLPPEHFGLGRDDFATYFNRKSVAKFTYNGKAFSVTIKKVLVYPQAFAAYTTLSSKDEKFTDVSRVFLVDIGGITTDVMLLRNNMPDLQFCRSLEMGTISLHNAINGKVNALHNMTIEMEHITDVLLKEKSTILPAEVTRTITDSAKQYAEDILDKLREIGVDLRSNPAIFVGGGSALLKPFISESDLVVQVGFLSNLNANAVGYQLHAAKKK